MHAGAGLNRQPDVLGDAEPREQVRQLERPPEAEAGALGSAQTRDVLALDHDRTLGGAQLARYQVEIGRLARAVRPDDGGELAGPEGAVDMVDRDMAAEPDGQAAGLERRGHRLLRIGISMSLMVSSRVSSGMPQATLGSTLILKAYIDCSA